MHSVAAAGLCAVVVLTGTRFVSAGEPVLAPTSCMITSAQYAFACYPPQQAKQAERLLAVAPINPSRVVRRLTGLSLSQVIAAKRLLPKPGKRVIAITYVYGTFPGGEANPPDPSPPLPKWMIISESIGHRKDVTGILIRRASSQGPGNVTPIPDTKSPWLLTANLPDLRLVLTVETNMEKTTVRRVGRGLIREAKHKGIAYLSR